MIDGKSILIFIYITIYLIIHKLKIRRFADDNDLTKKINAIFSGIIFSVMVISLRQVIWGSNTIIYIDLTIIISIVLVLLFVIIKDYEALKCLIVKVFGAKKSIIESVFLTTLLILGFLNDTIWLISLTVLIIFLAKEAILMSTSIKKVSNKD